MTKKFYQTGNEYVALPTINEQGALESLNYLSMSDRGVIEMTGEPFLAPWLKVDGKEVSMEELEWDWESYWIPRFKIENNGVTMIGRYVAPSDTKGWFFQIQLTTHDLKKEVEVGWNGHFGAVLHSINESKPVVGDRVVYSSLWNQGLVYDFRTGITKFSFAFLTEGGFDTESWEEETQRFAMSRKVEWETTGDVGTASLNLYMGIGLEEVSAVTQAIHMQRETPEHLAAQLRTWLDKRIETFTDKHIEKIYNLNQFFNYFYATGRTMDTEELVLCTSRSPRYYVSAAYWDRDSLIWSFPALLRTDEATAKEALEYVFTKQIRNIGIHSRYIDGTVLEPGFELDELCAPLLALERYLGQTGDLDFLQEPMIERGIKRILDRLMEWKHESLDLFGTFLMPTDDMRVYPVLTYNNVLVWKVLKFLSSLPGEKWTELTELAEKVKVAVMENMVVELDGKRLFAWSADGKGNFDFYDEPPGSLTLLAHYGFVEKTDPIFTNTMERLYSDQFPHYFKGTQFEELGCSHADHPWILSICNSLLNGRKEIALDMLKRTRMDNYIACESIDEETGLWVTGAHFATCAGFLVHALATAEKDVDK